MTTLPHPKSELGLAGRVARAFIDSKLTPLIIITSVLLGAVAIIVPREKIRSGESDKRKRRAEACQRALALGPLNAATSSRSWAEICETAA